MDPKNLTKEYSNGEVTIGKMRFARTRLIAFTSHAQRI